MESEYPNGDRVFRNSSGQIHRENGPAIIYSDGTGEVWNNGKFLYRTPVEVSTMNAAKTIQAVYSAHKLHKQLRPGGELYTRAKTNWDSTIDRLNRMQLNGGRTVGESELIFPQM